MIRFLASHRLDRSPPATGFYEVIEANRLGTWTIDAVMGKVKLDRFSMSGKTYQKGLVAVCDKFRVGDNLDCFI